MTRQRQADLFLVLTTLIAACGWIFSREAISGMPVFAFLGLRFFCAALVLLPFCYRQRIPLAKMRQVVISGCWLALNLCLWIWSVSTTPSLGEGAFIMSLSMLFVPLVAWGMMKNRPARAWWECLPVAMIGLALLSLQFPITFHASQGWFLLTAFVQSISFCYTSRCAREVPLLPLTAVQLAITGIAGLTISALFETWTQPVSSTTALWLVASILIATSLRFGLQLQGQKYAAVASAAIIMVLEPLLTVIAASIWYGERLPLQKIVGGVLILLAQIWFRWRMIAHLPAAKP
ncbi:DMT family transporter [Enterobacter sp. Bisph1]|uniref:DMT family transporter n=1 Tax=Enterobacter sp. Bisph1 TaxID=1274399 RepID=UPI00057BFD5F|nr:DMT family transporter [Enterobacter sp. Bisph1]